MDEKLIRRLVATIKCSVCGQFYQSDNVRVLGHDDDIWFVSAYCPKCESQALVAAVMKQGIFAEEVADFTEDEFDKFSEAEDITADDVLDIHYFLEEYEGDVASLLAAE